jgi:hypothetical protein
MKNVEKCNYADKYKATRPPTCGCFVCETKYRLKTLEDENQELREALMMTDDAARYATIVGQGALYVANKRR